MNSKAIQELKFFAILNLSALPVEDRAGKYVLAVSLF